ncbi:MAG: dephospho-CoA kinase [Saccharofermentanales bacterium]|jgi:dephospho-CoA kinase
MFVLGITGGIGTGKSTVASICRAAGLPVVDADRIAHDLTDTPGPTTERIAEVFGDAMLDASGALDRPKISDLAFNDKRALDRLSTIVHEGVVEAMDRAIAEAERAKQKAIVLDVPIPIERGFIDNCDQIWAVAAADDVRVKRLARRGMDAAEARRRMRVQMTRDEYRELADHEIVNDGTRSELEAHVHALLRQELGGRGIPLPGLPDD